ncbi:FG-GAP repeat protein [Luteolibacter flavescens]|uniref:FG-GAP repeat protein n=1 Tax=Luteolibacter flavescens TaxID=1859460 RepID=A0ABT3FLG5_9BACT|nr:FG-GAP repeat protein [Luteolibacter flavescens]MCW1884415.1 FG-GAP repeat protein [Luteolibacter flavescens]
MKLLRLLLGLALASSSLHAAPTPLGQLTPLGDSSYGSAMDASGTYAVVGCRMRAVDIGAVAPRTVELLERNPASGVWARAKVFTAPDPGLYFGWSVAIDGDNVVVGAPSLLGAGQEQPGEGVNGRVYVYSRNSGGTNAWGLQRTIVGPSEGTGAHVSLSGTHFAVGTPALLAGDVGRIQIHERNQGGAANWGQTAQIYNPQMGGSKGPGTLRFGTNFDLHGEVLVCGAIDDFEESTVVRTFLRNQGGPNVWGLSQTLPPMQPGYRQGLQVAVHGGRMVATGMTTENVPYLKIYWKDSGGLFTTSTAYMPVAGSTPRRVAINDELYVTMDREDSGDVRVTVSVWDGTTGDYYFEHSSRIIGREDLPTATYALAVATDGVLAGLDRVAGDPPSHRAGIIRPLSRNAGGANQFGPLSPIIPNAPGSGSFGRAMALAGNYLIVGESDAAVGGTDRGTAYLFQRMRSSFAPAAEEWRLRARLGPPTGVDAEDFGSSVAIGTGGMIAIGAPGAAAGGNAHLFQISAWGYPAFLTTLNRGMPTGDIRFGSAVAVVNNSEVLVGAPGADVDGTNAGAVYRYVRGASSWGWSSLLRTDADGSPAGDGFGNSLSFSSNRLAVGALSDENNGAVYMYDRSTAGAYTQAAKLQPSESGHGLFGLTVALREDRLVSGTFSLGKGEAFVFERGPGGWSQVARLGPASLDNFDSFGSSLAIGRDFIIAGAPGDDGVPIAPSSNRGIAYQFRRGPTTWTASNSLTPDYLNDSGSLLITGASEQRFGSGMAGSGDYFAIASPGYDAVGTDTGIVRFYRYGGFEQWAESESLPANLSGLHDDPDQDGQSNLLEYAAGSDPNDGSSMAQLAYSFVTSGGATYFHGRLLKPTSPERRGITYQLQGGTNLAIMSPSQVTGVVEDASEISGRYFQPLSTTPKAFLRLSVDYAGSVAP